MTSVGALAISVTIVGAAGISAPLLCPRTSASAMIGSVPNKQAMITPTRARGVAIAATGSVSGAVFGGA
ncbi:MAG: hypothetical protein WDO74_02010 [Pseudomonadota bacterium]